MQVPQNGPAKNDVGLRLLGPAFDPLSGPGAAQEAPGHTPGTAAKSIDVPGPPVWARGRARSVRRPPSVYLLDLKRGPVRYAKHRPPAGTQVKTMLVPARTGRSRPPVGYCVKRLAEDWLRDKLDERRFAGTYAPGRFPADGRLGPLNSDLAPQPARTRAIFADAAAEYFRFSVGRSRPSRRRAANTATPLSFTGSRCSATSRSGTSPWARSNGGDPACQAPATAESFDRGSPERVP